MKDSNRVKKGTEWSRETKYGRIDSASCSRSGHGVFVIAAVVADSGIVIT